ncbi:hypothetical protein I308_105882 [Cryptococcus tetragattii IND107]|uniref:REJ domain-containing protein n=1 Tax=Cryptococcus tetragattii IND107 TaxID=1296105 RepID=A0ABR3BLE1_9TREE
MADTSSVAPTTSATPTTSAQVSSVVESSAGVTTSDASSAAPTSSSVATTSRPPTSSIESSTGPSSLQPSTDPITSSSTSVGPSTAASQQSSTSSSVEPSSSTSVQPSSSTSVSSSSSIEPSTSAVSTSNTATSTSSYSSGDSTSSSSNASSASKHSTSVVVVTVTDSNGSMRVTSSSIATGAVTDAGKSGSGTNTGAIVGGVIGGVAGLAIILALLWFFCIKRRRNNEEAFDEKTFDPSRAARHSVNDPIDLLSPSVPAVGGAAASGNSTPRVDPFPFQNPSPENPFDSYSHTPMHMPDARDYMGGAYDPYGGMEGGYGVAAAAGIGAGAAADHYNYGENAYSSSDYPSTQAPVSPTRSSSAALAKQREAASERRTSRTSSGYNVATGSGNGPQEVIGSPTESESGGRRESGYSEGRTSFYQHTDMGSLPDEEEEQLDEIPPNYNSISRPTH